MFMYKVVFQIPEINGFLKQILLWAPFICVWYISLPLSSLPHLCMLHTSGVYRHACVTVHMWRSLSSTMYEKGILLLCPCLCSCHPGNGLQRFSCLWLCSHHRKTEAINRCCVSRFKWALGIQNTGFHTPSAWSTEPFSHLWIFYKVILLSFVFQYLFSIFIKHSQHFKGTLLWI